MKVIRQSQVRMGSDVLREQSEHLLILGYRQIQFLVAKIGLGLFAEAVNLAPTIRRRLCKRAITRRDEREQHDRECYASEIRCHVRLPFAGAEALFTRSLPRKSDATCITNEILRDC